MSEPLPQIQLNAFRFLYSESGPQVPGCLTLKIPSNFRKEDYFDARLRKLSFNNSGYYFKHINITQKCKLPNKLKEILS